MPNYILRLIHLSLLLLGPWLGTHFLCPEVKVEQQDWQTVHCEAVSVSPEARVQQRDYLNHQGMLTWQKQGLRGQNLKVAIFDSGFRGYRQFLGKALPKSVIAKSFRNDGNLEAMNSQHGILCAEVIHAIAPAAEIYLVNWENNDPRSFLNALQWARSQGVNIVSCSLIMPSWSDGEGGGKVNQALTKIVGDGTQAGDMLFFACTGNTADRHWAGRFQPTDEGYHAWVAGKTENLVQPWGRERVAVELYGPAAHSYELRVVDAITGESVGECFERCMGDSQEECTCRMIRFCPCEQRNYAVKVCRRDQDQPLSEEKFHLVVLGATLAHHTHHGSICFPADCPAAIAVGAVDQRCDRCFYSSCGPNSKHPKPDFVANVPFPSLWRDRPFTGTSAAAPQAAAIGALVWSKYRDHTARQIKQLLHAHALDLGPQGHDWETGHGLIQLPSERE